MKKLLRTLALSLAILIAVTLVPTGVLANTDSAQQTAAMKAELESKYGIAITYPSSSGGPAVGTATLDNLDKTLDYLGASFMRQLSSYYQQKTGNRLTVVYTYIPATLRSESGPILGAFTEETAQLELYIPRPGNTTLNQSGNSPSTILHEIGHAYQTFFADKYGYANLKGAWTAYNGGTAYSNTNSFDKTKFVSAYAASDFDEDFADTFAHAFACNRAGFSIAANLKSGGASTGLGNKVAFLERSLSMYMTDVAATVDNLRRCYTAPSQITYQGVGLSNSALQYIGFHAPQGVLGGALKSAGLNAQSSQWDSSIGGWLVADTSGRSYLLFPGGAAVQIK